ncbi:MAG: arabinofuranosyltransferase [Candidatus Latescibacterota bacterium]|jgi:arabinofuranosyltransferase
MPIFVSLSYYFIEDGKVVREGYLVQLASSGMLVTTWSNIGLSGFYAGPNVHIIDSIALADPLLSRLPAIDNPQWGPGHFGRIMPAGYIESYLNDHNEIADPNLGLYYEVLAHVIRGSLLSSNRLLEIWRLNTGYYDHLINTRAYRFPSN